MPDSVPPAGELNLERFREGGPAGEGVRAPASAGSAMLEAGRSAARQGDRDQARRLLRSAVELDPNCAEAWLGLAWLAETAPQREAYLRRVLVLEPGHARAQEELARLQRSAPPSARGGEAARRGAGLWLWGPLALAGAVVLVAAVWFGPSHAVLARFLATPTPTALPTPTLTPAEVAGRFVPQLEMALADENWDRALDIVAIMQGVDPTGEQVKERAFSAHLHYGQALVRDGASPQALEQFEQALALAPHDASARRWQQATLSYQAGRDALAAGDWGAAAQSFLATLEQVPAYADAANRLQDAYLNQGQAAIDAGDWSAAIQSLTQAQELAPGDSVVADLLVLAYRQRGIAFEEQGELQQARADLEAALELQPGDAEAQSHLDRVMYRLFPPKRIEIDISKQRLYAYAGDDLVFRFVVSTGLPGRDTAAGHYKVLDKIPMAYSAVWRLKMPYWLGIYYVGNIENGIHALPIRPDGTVMWGGFLGQKASYGCIILDNDDAIALYNWAEVGTKVDIHY